MAQRDSKGRMVLGGGVPVLERFWPKVQKSDGCWEWTSARDRAGYGRISEGTGGSLYAHRVSYEAANGPIPPGMMACHTCDNRGCVNPDHIFLGKQLDNMKDASGKGRVRVPGLSGARHPMAKLTQAQVNEIRSRRKVRGDTARMAQEFGVSAYTINEIRSGRSWRS